jgi:hypothetical protein
LRASGEVFFLLTMTYMDVGKPSKWRPDSIFR